MEEAKKEIRKEAKIITLSGKEGKIKQDIVKLRIANMMEDLRGIEREFESVIFLVPDDKKELAEHRREADKFASELDRLYQKHDKKADDVK